MSRILKYVHLSVNLVKSMITDVMDVVLDKVVGQEGAVVINSAYVMHVLVRYQLICFFIIQ